jgi:S-adenosylmethionine:diacylglycerol 3-amino-3-carboxypropyl transferase
LDGPLPKLCLAVSLSHQDGHHSAVALLLKAALIQVSDYRLLGASGLISEHFHLWFNGLAYSYIKDDHHN